MPVLQLGLGHRYCALMVWDHHGGEVGNDIAGRGWAYGMPGVAVDGQDVFAVYEAAGEAVRRARAGQGPTLLECQTYRYFGHFEGDTVKYRTRDEEAYYQARDCLARFL